MDTNSVQGYYNDLTKKADWKGESDEDGIPVNVLSNGEKIYFPITVAQMALGNYDLWLEKREHDKKYMFLKLAQWLKANQNDIGAWNNHWNFTRPSALTNYSAMAQGEGISTFARAYQLNKDKTFVESAEKAFDHMITSVENNGCAYYLNEDIYLEEYPENTRSTVLNGYIFALFGIYDLVLLTRRDDVKEVLKVSLSTLEKNLPIYDAGFWTYYDLQKTMSSPFYHSLHISLLNALYLLTGREPFKFFSEKWSRYEKNPFYKTKALLTKMLQKLKNPAKVTVKI